MGRSEVKQIADILHEMDMRAAMALNECRLDDALNIYHEILKAQQQLKLEQFSGHTLLNIANIYMAMEAYSEALHYIDEAEKLKTIQRCDEDSANLQMFRSNCLYKMNQVSEAENILLKELKKNKDRRACGKIQLMLYSYYMDAKKNSKARSSIDSAINNFKTAGDNNELIRALNCRADYFTAVGQNVYAELDRSAVNNLVKNTPGL
ncbi:hypothetical protein SAMN02910298_00801 [Pseudobutyrivibrio sp. YE44]|uniref:hypothetical protein n=1 Tax=Pseudobutyrivibrio sp. YE44 TaxID=1520802 RepID=UPI0008865E54|nr:hypothetical protein [Pseudobutyrivibrio sp. YE44]SDB15014.1 hypothetical protein SAMN02910298_00801 [Pseudobutyrivibrio sp. YE44]